MLDKRRSARCGVFAIHEGARGGRTTVLKGFGNRGPFD